MIGVVDTSALIRLFIPDGPLPEGFEEFLRGVERGQSRAMAPELILAEAGNVIHRKHKTGELSEDEADQILTEIMSLPMRLFPHRSIIIRALELAREHDTTVYDCLYLALAEEQGAFIFSADQKLLKIAIRLHLK